MGNVVAGRTRGNIVYIDHSRHLLSLVDAIGPDVVKDLIDFVDEPVDLTSGEYDPKWTITRVEAGAGESTFGPLDFHGGAGRVTTDAAENDGINAQRRGESFKLVAGKPLYFGTRMRLSEATQSDFFVGLAITDTTILGGITDSIGWDKVDGSTVIKAHVNKNSTRTEQALALAQNANAWHTLEFYFNGAGLVRFFEDNVETTRLAAFTNIPDDEELRISLHVLTGEAVAHTADFDWIRCIQIGRG